MRIMCHMSIIFCHKQLSYWFFFFQAEDGIRVPLWSRGLGDVYKRQCLTGAMALSNFQLFQQLSKIHESVNDKSLSTTLSTVKKSMVRGYCTLFLINIGQWSMGGLSIDISSLTMDGGLVVGLVELMFVCFVCVYLSKKPFFLVGDF